MYLTRTIKIQLVAFAVVATASILFVCLAYVKLPATVFGIGRYTVKMQLAQSGDLYPRANVTYRGTTVGHVDKVRLTDSGVEADLSLRSGIPIPSDLDAQVHSVTAIGEQYVALVPRPGTSAPLKNGDVIASDRTSVPPNIGALLEAANRGVEAIPNGNLKTVIDEGYTALGGLSPEFSRLVQGGTTLAIDADKNRDALTSLIDNSKPVLDSQIDTASSIHAWAAHLATITGQLKTQDSALAGVLVKGSGATDEARALFDRLKPTLPTLLANLVSVEKVAIVYQPAIEQLLVLLPQGIAEIGATMVPDLYNKTDYRGFYLSFNLFNIGLPPTCASGFLPASQKRGAEFEDSPPRAPGNVYCRTPQDGMWNVRGAKNYPCLAKPGKRAPTAQMCESDEQYVPLNDGDSWKGDPNGTLSGQDIPQLPPGSPPAAAPLPGPAPPAAPIPAAAAQYDPATGKYVGPDGRIYTQGDLAANAPKEKNWQSMLMPPGN
jgi:phospholipid/cholesterol/gamma-HCH transport system substrate-binding protein